MSTSASLAAAKKRRGVQNDTKNDMNNNMSKNNINNDFRQEIVSIPNMIRRHEMRLYKLEKRSSENNNNEYATKKDLELLPIEKNISGNNSKYDNMFENNKEELSTLKNNIQSLTKTVNEMNSILQGLRATIITQESDISSLKEGKELN